MTETARRKFQQCVNHQRVKQRAQHEDHAAKGLQTFIENNKRHKVIDDDQCFIVDGDVSFERTQILVTTHSVTKNLIGKEQLVF